MVIVEKLVSECETRLADLEVVFLVFCHVGVMLVKAVSV